MRLEELRKGLWGYRRDDVFKFITEMEDEAAKKLAEQGEAAMTKVTSTVQVEGVPASLYETCQAHLPSPLMASGELVGGQIESVEQKPYYVLGPDGEWIQDPEHVTLLFTATTETPTSAVMTTKVGEQEVRIGKTDYILKSEYIEFSGGTIVDVTWED